MNATADTYFELNDSGNFIRVEPQYAPYENAENDWDRNWISARVTVISGGFSGGVFQKAKKNLDKDFKATAQFEPLERQLRINIKGDAIDR